MEIRELELRLDEFAGLRGKGGGRDKHGDGRALDRVHRDDSGLGALNLGARLLALREMRVNWPSEAFHPLLTQSATRIAALRQALARTPAVAGMLRRARSIRVAQRAFVIDLDHPGRVG